ncbi:MAG: carboxypeptidase regulatory-like domain-containing protein [Deltaproteobacteria bacterium]|nr:carboxypeptidase regulatory-like domain-containing protein [Deltaproteobacteria bacterium]
MRRLAYLDSLLMALCLALSGCFGFDNPKEVDSSATIRAQIARPGAGDSAPVPLVGAQCTLEGTNHTATSDANGGIEFDGVAPGSYLIICTLDGRSYLLAVEVQAGETKELGTVALTKKTPSCDVNNGGCDSNATCSTGLSLRYGDHIECVCKPGLTCTCNEGFQQEGARCFFYLDQ